MKRWCCKDEEGLFEPNPNKESKLLVGIAMGKSHRCKIPAHVANMSQEFKLGHCVLEPEQVGSVQEVLLEYTSIFSLGDHDLSWNG